MIYPAVELQSFFRRPKRMQFCKSTQCSLHHKRIHPVLSSGDLFTDKFQPVDLRNKPFHHRIRDLYQHLLTLSWTLNTVYHPGINYQKVSFFHPDAFFLSQITVFTSLQQIQNLKPVMPVRCSVIPVVPQDIEKHIFVRRIFDCLVPVCLFMHCKLTP